MKKLVLAVLVGTLCLGATSAYAQKNLMKGAAKAVSSKAPASLGRQVERQLAKQTAHIPCVPNAAYKYPALSLERVVDEAMHPEINISKLVPVQLTNRADLINSSLLRVQQSIQQYGKIPTGYSGHRPDIKVTWLAYQHLLLEDRKGNLSPQEQIQLRYLFWHTNTSISSVERKLQSWQDRYRVAPMLPNKEDLDYLSGVNKPPYGEAFEGWALAADIYMLQKLYGEDLPKRIKNTNVIPYRERQIAVFKQKLKKEQETVEHLRATGEWDRLWMKEAVVDIVYNDADKLAFFVRGFYHFFIDKHLKIFPRAKYLKTSQEGRLYEIPLQKGLLLEGPSGKKTITPEEYVIFKADGEKSILLKRTDVELLTDPSSYGE